MKNVNSNKKLNFLLFMPETVRADAIFGDPERTAKTPVMDKLAQEGVSFTNCFSQSPFCTPSRCSMFTGLYPHTLGHRSLLHLLHNHERNIFQDLKEAGYTTVAFGKNDLLAQDSISASFDSVELLVKPEPNFTQPSWGKDHKYYKAFYKGRREGETFHDSDWACVESALKFLDEDHNKPFCLFLPLCFAHPPYVVEEPYFSMHDRLKMPEPFAPDLSGKRKGLQMVYKTQKLDMLTKEDLREIRATYYGMISRLDHQLGSLIDKLKERNLYDTTAIIVFSDHGDYAGDYGLVEKWNLGFENALLHIPLIMHIPDYGSVGKVCQSLVEMVDLYPTILDIAGINSKHYHFGQSLSPLLKSDKNKHQRNAVFAEVGWAVDEKQCFTPFEIVKGGPYENRGKINIENPEICARAAMVRTTRYKYVYCPGDRDELYDIVHDPSEIKNLADTPKMQTVKNELKNTILEWLLRTSDTVPLEYDKRSFK